MSSDSELDNNINCYALRRVNPFLGVMQVMDTEVGRASSTNGIVWDIEVITRDGIGWSPAGTRNVYMRYGLWSQDEGLVSRPLASQMDDQQLLEQSELIIHSLLENLDRLPFQLQDTQELWLFDQTGEHAIALLDSVVAGQTPASPEPRFWTSRIGVDGLPSQRRFRYARELEQQVKQYAGFNTKKRWISRQQNGNGIEADSGREYSAQTFPVYLLNESWPDEKQYQLVQQYIDWIAPGLLTLQHLDKSQRQRLEKKIHVQAISIEHHLHLYPEILDRKGLTAARVQSRLQLSRQEPELR